MLNDCKYGVSVRGGSIRLSLHKAGCRPDPTGDSGVHDVTYAFLPHPGPLSADTVIRPAYCLNSPALVFDGVRALPQAPVTTDCPHVMIEAVKPLHETAVRSIVVRLYECEGAGGYAAMDFAPYVCAAAETDLLEEGAQEVPVPQATLYFKPFEVKTLVLTYEKP